KSTQQGKLIVDHHRLHQLDLKWSEKIWALLDFLQLYGLLWSLSQPWPWPRHWQTQTRWGLIFNMDFSGLSDEGAAMAITGGTVSPWGQYEGYLTYALGFMLIPVTLVFLWMNRLELISLREKLFTLCGLHSPKTRLAHALFVVERALLLSAHVGFLPVALAIARLLVCEADGTLSIDTSVKCGSLAHSFVSLVGVAVLITFAAILLWRTRAIAMAATVYDHGPDHERMLQRMEIEYALNLSDDWAMVHIWVVSSFRRHAVDYRVRMVIQKIILLAIYCGLRWTQGGQAVLFWAVITAWTIWSCASPPYRCLSSNRVHLCLQLALWINSFLGMLTGYGVRSAVLVASTQYLWLSAINAVALISAGLATMAGVISPVTNQVRDHITMHIFQHHSHQCSSSHDATLLNTDLLSSQGGRIHSRSSKDCELGLPILLEESSHRKQQTPSDTWPSRVTLEHIAYFPHRTEWITASQDARRLLFRYKMASHELLPLEPVEEVMTRVRQHWLVAKAENSAIEPVLRGTLEDLVHTYESVCKKSLLVKSRTSGRALHVALGEATVAAGMWRWREAQVSQFKEEI
ncbi:unnamed protein product, partial [Choristocarpus tenellus]